jgi:RluA family pseudouridine synthase
VPKRPDFIELGERKHCVRIPILYEDRSVLALDKPAGWMLVPFNWQRTPWNLQAAITSAIRAGYFWSKSRNLKFLQNIHRLDAETTGILLFGKSPGAVDTFGDLFESRQMEKRYLAVVDGVPKRTEWVCEARLGSAPEKIGRVIVDARQGKDAVTAFRVLESRGRRTLLEAHPRTGRTHQIRVHLASAGHPIAGDAKYGDFGLNRQLARGAGVPARLERMFLHARRLRFVHPVSGLTIDLTAELPKECDNLVAALLASNNNKSSGSV